LYTVLSGFEYFKKENSMLNISIEKAFKLHKLHKKMILE
jgi:hypothetical protein